MNDVGNLEKRADALAENISYLQKKEEIYMISEEEDNKLKMLYENYSKTLKQVEIKWAQKSTETTTPIFFTSKKNQE